ncbi:MAG: hypothetical protein WB974_11175 [Acidobacteriaceae bacterium]
MAGAQTTLHITHQYENVDAQSLIGLPMGSHKTIVDKSGDLRWSEWSLARKGLAVTFGFSQQLDGELGIQLLSGGSALTVMGQDLDQGRFPFVVTQLAGSGLTVTETAFPAQVDETGMDVVLVQASNSGNDVAELTMELSGKLRNLPGHVSGASLATEEGLVLAEVAPALPATETASENSDLLLVQHRSVPAHGATSFWIERPYDWPVSRKSGLPPQRGAELLATARRSWTDLWARGTQIDLPQREHELENFYLSSVAYVLILTEHDAKGELWTLDGPAEYREFWGRGEYFQGRAIEAAGYKRIAQESVDHTFSLQRYDGEWDWPVTSGWPAWDNIGGDAASVWDYYLYSRNKQWLTNAYPYLARAAQWITLHREETEVPADAPKADEPIQRPVPGKCMDEPNPTLKPGEKPYWYGLLPWGYGDSGLPSGHPFPHNMWALYAIEVAEKAATTLGKNDDARRFAADAADYRQAILTSMRRSIALETEDAPYLPAMPTYPNGGVSQSLIAVYPTGFLSADNEWVTNLLHRMQQTELQGLPTDMAWMGRSGVWPGESMNVAETYLRRGNVAKTVELLLASLNHSYTTNVWKEEIKVDKRLPTACTVGNASKVPDGHGTGDMPEAWGNANLVLLVRDMLLRDDGGTLHVLSGIPAEWIKPGEHMGLTDAPTTFGGKVSFRLDDVAADEMKLHVDATVTIPEAVLRFPLPAGEKIRSVTVNGRPVQPTTEDTVTIAPVTGPLTVDAHLRTATP